MELEKYDRLSNHDNDTYQFESVGPKGRIKKAVKFRRVKGTGNNLYNLHFGDLIESTGEVNDLSVSNNKDRDKVLSTVAGIVHDFIKSRPLAIILAIGSTPARTRLYQMSITSFLSEISSEYNIYGNVNGDWMAFEKGVNYDGFLLLKKI